MDAEYSAYAQDDEESEYWRWFREKYTPWYTAYYNNFWNMLKFTPDQQTVIAACNGDPRCEKIVERIFAGTPRYVPYFSWPLGDHCQTWAFQCEQNLNSLTWVNEGLSIESQYYNYMGWIPLWSAHVIVRVELPTGYVFYMDNAYLGGDDHIFFEVPSDVLYTEEQYKQYLQEQMERASDVSQALMNNGFF